MVDLNKSKTFELTRCKTTENIYSEDAKFINEQVSKNIKIEQDNRLGYNSEEEYVSENFECLIRKWKKDSEITDNKINSLILKQDFYKKKLSMFRYKRSKSNSNLKNIKLLNKKKDVNIKDNLKDHNEKYNHLKFSKKNTAVFLKIFCHIILIFTFSYYLFELIKVLLNLWK